MNELCGGASLGDGLLLFGLARGQGELWVYAQLDTRVSADGRVDRLLDDAAVVAL